jgi:hypothetical protein
MTPRDSRDTHNLEKKKTQQAQANKFICVIKCFLKRHTEAKESRRSDTPANRYIQIISLTTHKFH